MYRLSIDASMILFCKCVIIIYQLRANCAREKSKRKLILACISTDTSVNLRSYMYQLVMFFNLRVPVTCSIRKSTKRMLTKDDVIFKWRHEVWRHTIGTVGCIMTPHRSSLLAIFMYPSSPHLVPQLFLINQYGLGSLPNPTTSAAWFAPDGSQLRSLYTPVLTNDDKVNTELTNKLQLP